MAKTIAAEVLPRSILAGHASYRDTYCWHAVALGDCAICRRSIDPSGAAISTSGQATYVPFFEDLRSSDDEHVHSRCFVDRHGLDRLLSVMKVHDERQRIDIGQMVDRLIEPEPSPRDTGRSSTGNSMTLTGDGLRLTLEVGGYEYENTSAEDANWLRGSARLDLNDGRGDRFTARCSVSWTTSELAYFNEALRTLLEDLTGTARLSTLEDQVELSVNLKQGRGTISGRIGVHARAMLDFEDIETDQAQLAEASKALARIVRQYPARP